MNISAHISEDNIIRLNQAMSEYVLLFGKNAEEIATKWSRVLIREVMSRTPPLGSEEESAKKQGQKAVIRDLKKAVEPIATSKDAFRKYDRIAGPTYFDWMVFGDSKSIKKVIEKRDNEAFTAIIKSMPKMSKKEVVPFAESLHTTARGKDKRVKVKSNKITLDVEEWKRYADKLLEKVGKLRASWIPAAKALDLKIPVWANRHQSYGYSVTSVDNKLQLPEHSITIDNNSGGIGKVKDFVNFSARLIADRMRRDIDYKLAYMKKKAGFTN